MENKFKKTIEAFKEAYEEEIFPGAVFAIGNNKGELLRYKVGYRDLDTRELVDFETKYDIASLTKIVVTTMILLKLIDDKVVNLDDKIDKYLMCKSNITIKDLMTHTSGIKAHCFLKDIKRCNKELALDILDIEKNYERGCKVEYSCLGYIVLGRILEIIENAPLDVLAKKYIFDKLNMKNTCYNPITRNVASTEKDDENNMLKGIVHDENARYLGGIAGNAGIFSTIDDMSKFALMLANHGGQVCSKKIFLKAIENYTDGLGENRGLGFSLWSENNHPSSLEFSKGSYGHTGFTGTSIFVDKDTGFYLVLLSNRVHPTRQNLKIIKFRRKFHEIAMKEYKKYLEDL